MQASESMENNLLIGGLKETDDENCHHIVQNSYMTLLGLLN